jgi:cellulose synthase/poly-beta-1,6-N-acetylglucosamine synthase-like glycosyltransferase
MDRFLVSFHCMSICEIAWFVAQMVFTLWIFVTINCGIYASMIRTPATRRRSESFSGRWPNVGIIVPCYLPNEQHILMDSLERICASVYAGSLAVYVPYNTPSLLEIEKRLAATKTIGETSVVCAHVKDSMSKAENVMYALYEMMPDSVEVVVVFDADHHPELGTVERLVRVLEDADDGCVCVQGAVHVEREGPAWLRWLVHGMEWLNFNFFAPGMALVVGSAWFGGAGAAWKRNELQEFGLDSSCVTEDVDLSFRVMLSGKTVKLAPWARTHEMCPATLRIFLRQRLRWALGWEQTTVATIPRLCAARLSVFRRVRIASLLTARYFGVSSGVFAICGAVYGVARHIQERQRAIALPITLLSSISGYTTTSALVVILMVLAFNGDSLQTSARVVTCLALSPVLVTFNGVTICCGLITLLCGHLTWVPTTRAASDEVHRIPVRNMTQYSHLKMPPQTLNVYDARERGLQPCKE